LTVAVSIPILMFHALDDLEPPLSFPPQVFRACMNWLREQGIRALTVTDAWRCLQSGAEPDGPTVAISFDDGYQSVFEIALPVLREIGFGATVFVNDSGKSSQLAPMEGRARMSWTQISTLAESGFEIGAHTLTHPDLTRMSESQMEAEIAGSRAAVEGKVGVVVTSFAYPFGLWNAAARRIASQHFECACTTGLRTATSESDAYTLPRIECSYFRSVRMFRLLASPALPAYLAARRVPRAMRAWVR
jgi:peptidoglycan/xylan/chitin deacetylase (PgdA/CDA1 family)